MKFVVPKFTSLSAGYRQGEKLIFLRHDKKTEEYICKSHLTGQVYIIKSEFVEVINED